MGEQLVQLHTAVINVIFLICWDRPSASVASTREGEYLRFQYIEGWSTRAIARVAKYIPKPPSAGNSEVDVIVDESDGDN